MDLLQLRYFQIVARTEHMTRAAQELSVSQPSLSKTIRRLEGELGVPLFERQGREIRLNSFGQLWRAHVERALGELEEGQRDLRDLAGLEQGLVRVVTAALTWLPDILERFHEAYPSVRFQLCQRPLAQIPPLLQTGAWDFGLVSIALHHPGIVWRPVRTDDLVLIVPVGHWLAEREHVALREVANEDMILESVGNGFRSLIDIFCQQAGFTPRIACEIDDPTVTIGLVKAHLGIAFGPALLRRQLDDQTLRLVSISEPHCQRTLGMAWHDGHYLSQAARVFRQFVFAYFEVQAVEETPAAL